ncbi:MAG: YraN family protein [Candidatus Margulisiibacteriota bacterium]|nr:YraN family protein [Candidatus Margulisiibacteriota bacterium]
MGKWSKELGAQGEEAACRYLEQKGFYIIERNFYSSHGEIDIVAADNDFLVFVEVKNYSFRSYGTPVGAIGRTKRQNLIITARTYLSKKGNPRKHVRFDVVTIYRSFNGEKIIKHYKNAFYVKGDNK